MIIYSIANGFVAFFFFKHNFHLNSNIHATIGDRANTNSTNIKHYIIRGS